MFKMRPRSKNKAAFGGAPTAEEESLAEENGLQLIIKEEGQVYKIFFKQLISSQY